MTSIPTQVTFRGIAHSDALEANIRNRVAALQRSPGSILACRVIIELPHRRGGRHFHVRVAVDVADGARVVATHAPSLHASLRQGRAAAHHKEAELAHLQHHAAVAVREAFEAARRQLRDWVGQRRGDVKTHAAPRTPAAGSPAP